MSIRSTISHNFINIPGWHTNRHLLIIESDDWGSVRMPSKDAYDLLLGKGIRVDKDPYCRFDALASSDDLMALFDVLSSVVDSNGRPAVITANAVVANPDFERIKDDGFRNYYYEPFTVSLSRSRQHEKSFKLWKQGITAGIFHPQFHGREHLSVKQWLKSIREGDVIARLAFDHHMFGLSPTIDSSTKNFMGAFNSGLDSDIKEYGAIITEGLGLFKDLFGFGSESFIAPKYTWSPKLEPCFISNGIKFLQGMVSQRIPIDDGKTFTYKNNNFCGKKSIHGLTYLMRNCFFEPLIPMLLRGKSAFFQFLSELFQRQGQYFHLR